MLRKFLRSKLHNLKVTENNVNYSGSITLDSSLIDEADIKPFEMVKVVNITSGERFETYVIEGLEGSGTVGLNGGAAKKGRPGDRLIVFSSSWIKEGAESDVRVIIADENNRIKEIKKNKIRF